MITQLRTWLANVIFRGILRLTKTKLMYQGLILDEEEILAVPPDAIQ